MRAVIVAHGDVLPSDRASVTDGAMIIAANGGALALERWKILPHLVVGDMDSLGQAGVGRLAKRGGGVAKFDPAQDESDLPPPLPHANGAGPAGSPSLRAPGGGRVHPQRPKPPPSPR